MITDKRLYWFSFAGGEMAPEMYGRVDLPKQQTGLKRCENFAITPQGVAVKRPGTHYVATLPPGGLTDDARAMAYGNSTLFDNLLVFTHQRLLVYFDSTQVADIVTPYTDVNLIYNRYAQRKSEFTIAHKNYPLHVLREQSGPTWTFAPVAFNVTLGAPTSPLATAHTISDYPSGDPKVSYRYAITTVDDGGRESAPALTAAVTNVLRIAGCNNVVSWSSVTGAARYNVYCARGQGSFGFVGSCEGPPFVDDNIEPDLFTQPPEVLESFSTSVTNPGAVAFFDQRCLLAATWSELQSFWASGIGNYGYFKASQPAPQADQAFSYEIADNRTAEIRHILAMGDLVMFTKAGAHRIESVDGTFTANSIRAVPVNAVGASDLAPPLALGNAILYPAARGGHVHSLRYDGSLGFKSEDTSLIAPHLTEGARWIDCDVQEAPHPTWWGVPAGGSEIVGMTYVPDQQVSAWFRWVFPGATVLSVAVISWQDRDIVYVITRRTVNGFARRFIERVDAGLPAAFPSEHAHYVDCGVVRYGFGGTVATGLQHLEGEEVVALVDGRPLGPFTVQNGEVDFGFAYEEAHVGLPYSATLETMPLAYAMPAYAVGVTKNVSAVHLRVTRSAGLCAGSSKGELYPMDANADDLIGDPPKLETGIVQVPVAGSWNMDETVVVKQDMPLPAEINALAIDFAGGE